MSDFTASLGGAGISEPRLRDANRSAFLAWGEPLGRGKVDSMQCSNVESRTPGHISACPGLNVSQIMISNYQSGYDLHRYNDTTKACLAAWWYPHKGGPADSPPPPSDQPHFFNPVRSAWFLESIKLIRHHPLSNLHFSAIPKAMLNLGGQGNYSADAVFPSSWFSGT